MHSFAKGLPPSEGNVGGSVVVTAASEHRRFFSVEHEAGADGSLRLASHGADVAGEFVHFGINVACIFHGTEEQDTAARLRSTVDVPGRMLAWHGGASVRSRPGSVGVPDRDFHLTYGVPGVARQAEVSDAHKHAMAIRIRTRRGSGG